MSHLLDFSEMRFLHSTLFTQLHIRLSSKASELGHHLIPSKLLKKQLQPLTFVILRIIHSSILVSQVYLPPPLLTPLLSLSYTHILPPSVCLLSFQTPRLWICGSPPVGYRQYKAPSWGSGQHCRFCACPCWLTAGRTFLECLWTDWQSRIKQTVSLRSEPQSSVWRTTKKQVWANDFVCNVYSCVTINRVQVFIHLGFAFEVGT